MLNILTWRTPLEAGSQMCDGQRPKVFWRAFRCSAAAAKPKHHGRVHETPHVQLESSYSKTRCENQFGWMAAVERRRRSRELEKGQGTGRKPKRILGALFCQLCPKEIEDGEGTGPPISRVGQAANADAVHTSIPAGEWHSRGAISISNDLRSAI